jgi:HSP20 family protein
MALTKKNFNSLFDDLFLSPFNTFDYPMLQSRDIFRNRNNRLDLIKIDLKENETQYEILADLPGYNRENIQVTHEGDTLTISTKRLEEKTQNNEYYHHYERFTGSNSRSLRLPKSVDIDQLKAKYQDGVLNIIVPKMNKDTLPKSITIE